MAPKSRVTRDQPMSFRCDASARAPAGLCAASIRTSTPRTTKRSSLAGHSHSPGPSSRRRPGYARLDAPARPGGPPHSPRCRADVPRNARVTRSSDRVRVERRSLHPRCVTRSAPHLRRGSGLAFCDAQMSRMTRSAASGTRPQTSGTPGLTMPAFSRAMDSSVCLSCRLVIEVDRRDGRRDRRDDIRRVQAASQANLEHRDVNRSAPEQLERRGRRDFRERRQRFQNAAAYQRVNRRLHGPSESRRSTVAASRPSITNRSSSRTR